MLMSQAYVFRCKPSPVLHKGLFLKIAFGKM